MNLQNLARKPPRFSVCRGSASDNILLNMLDYAKQYLSTGHSWIKFDIDNSKITTSQYETDYDFGELRKISKLDIKDVMLMTV